MVHVGNVEGGEVVVIYTEMRNPDTSIIVVLNGQPYRVDAFLKKIKTKGFLGFFLSEHGCGDLHHAGPILKLFLLTHLESITRKRRGPNRYCHYPDQLTLEFGTPDK